MSALKNLQSELALEQIFKILLNSIPSRTMRALAENELYKRRTLIQNEIRKHKTELIDAIGKI